MKLRLEWLLSVVLAIVACVLVVMQAPQREPYPDTKLAPAGSSIEKQAEAAARFFGVELESWRYVARTRSNTDLRLAFENDLVDPRWQLRDSFSYVAQFFGPGRDRCVVELDLHGRVVSFDNRASREPAEAMVGGPSLAAEARLIAMTAYERIWSSPYFSGERDDYGFRLTADAVLERDGYAFEWTSGPDRAGMLTWKLRFLVRDGSIVHFQISPMELEPLRAVNRARDQQYQLAFLLALIVGLVAVISAVVIMLLNLMRGRLPWRFVIRSAVLLSIFIVLDFAMGERYNRLLIALRGDYPEIVLLLTGAIIGPAAALAVMAAGRATRVATDFRRWLGMEDFLQLKWNKASVTSSFIAAFLTACVWLGISYAILAVSLDSLAESLTLASTVLDVPPIAGIYSLRTLAILLIVLFGFPVIKAHVRNRRLQALVAVLAATTGCVLVSLIEYPIGSLLLEALAHGLLLVYVYHRHGVLSAALGAIAAPVLGRAFVFFERGEFEPQAWGLGVLVLSGVALGVCTLLYLRNPSREEELRLSQEEFETLKRESERHLVSRREALQGEFALAEQAQRRMLPDHPPRVPGLEIASVCLPAQQVGGDMFDYLMLPDGRWLFCVADVSGKGVSASLYMTMLKGLLKSVCQVRSDLCDIASTLNQHLYRITGRQSFVTVVLAAFDSATSQLEILRAGHPPALHASASGSASFIDSQGMGLGMVSNALFSKKLNTVRLHLAPGDVVVLYSDGVTEAMNRQREEYGPERLEQLIKQEGRGNVVDILERVLAGLRIFQDGAAVHDDVTLMVLRARKDAVAQAADEQHLVAQTPASFSAPAAVAGPPG